jgi:uncharacterized Zn finger protein
MSKRQTVYCQKCSYMGQPQVITQIIKGYGNKIITKCAKCQELISIVDNVPNAEERPGAAQLKF